MPHIFVASLPELGHITPHLGAVAELVRRGCQVTWALAFPSAPSQIENISGEIVRRVRATGAAVRGTLHFEQPSWMHELMRVLDLDELRRDRHEALRVNGRAAQACGRPSAKVA